MYNLRIFIIMKGVIQNSMELNGVGIFKDQDSRIT